MLDFLLSLFKSGLSYSSVHTARCALSTFIMLDCQPCGSHPMVCRFLKSVFQQRPPASRYSEVWDVKDVLTFLSSIQTSVCSLKDLSIKLVLLMSLVTAQRGQTLHLLSLDKLSDNDSELVFRFNSLLKQSKPGRLPKPFVLKVYPENRELCVVTALREYIERTVSLRGTEKKLLVGYIKPHKAVSRDTVSRWIKTGLTRAGVDTGLFAAHSTRAAATSAAFSAAVPVKDILEKADWSSETTFARFYNKPLIHKENALARAVLSQD